jgi:hypothetical protein
VAANAAASSRPITLIASSVDALAPRSVRRQSFVMRRIARNPRDASGAPASAGDASGHHWRGRRATPAAR